ncbi:protein RDM16-like [Silene latifolia]|uniref:protein RDM16-like n=1 Tax=Silene latifolia TaxID=37657 RepID=UPI003D7752E3
MNSHPKRRINSRLVGECKSKTRLWKQAEPIPNVEWWDVPLLRSDNYIEDDLKMEKITRYVLHPESVVDESLPPPPPPQPIRLTTKERKKLRTQQRLLREKDRQEMIRKGLMEAPKGKGRMSNVCHATGFENVQEPTKSERAIRKAADERVQSHVDRNMARKLTPAECSEKKKRKLFHDPNCLDTLVSVYRINDRVSPQNRFKIDINAQQNHLTGCLVLFKDFRVVVVEGGSKSIKRYRKLMLGRIYGSDDSETDEEEEANNKCDLVWQGSVDKPSFNKFSVHHCLTQDAANKVFSAAGVSHYWDLAANFSIHHL